MTIRTRTRGSFDVAEQTYTTTTFGGAVSSVQQGFWPAGVGSVQTTTDVVTPKYHSRVARGDIINNPFTSVVESKSHSFSGHTIVRNSGSGSTIKSYDWQYAYGYPPRRSDWYCELQPAMEEASTEALAKVASTDVDGVVEAAEGRQTMQLFDVQQYNLRRQILKELRYAEKRGKKFPASVPVSVLSNNWLMYRYGIGPFLSLLHDTIVVGSRIRTVRETSRGFGSTGGHEVFKIYHNSGSFHNVEHTVYRDWSGSVRAGILYDYRNFGNRYGFSLANLPGAAWELVPWSFVADWFINMGDFIRALTPRLQTVQRASWLGYEVDLTFNCQSVVGPLKVTGYTVTRQQSGAALHRIVTRRRWPHNLSASLYIRENALREVVTSKRIVDAFALTSQLFFKLMRRT